jgi:hypothetical protein
MKMSIKNFLKTLVMGRNATTTGAYVHETAYETDLIKPHGTEYVTKKPVEPDVDLSPQKDLENYAQGLSVSKKTLEQLISSGLLMPGEIEIAEKIVRFMRKRDRGPGF